MMTLRGLALLGGLSLFAASASAQTVLFDFDSLPAHSGLPGAYTVGGITASFSATGQGFSIQAANTMGFTPVGFAGNCIYPNSIYASDLLIGFSTSLTYVSILYAPQELGCDDSRYCGDHPIAASNGQYSFLHPTSDMARLDVDHLRDS